MSKSVSLTTFACLNLAAKCSDSNLLNSGVVVYSSWLWSVVFFSILTLGILFSTAAREIVVAKLAVLGISPLASFILALRVVLVAKLVISSILSSIFFILELYIYLF